MTRIAVGQMQPKILDKHENILRTKEILDKALEEDVEVLVLPELANSGYAFHSNLEVRLIADEIPDGEYCRILAEWSENSRMIVAGLCESDGKHVYNSAVVFGNGEYITTYKKINLFNRELDWFEPGQTEPPVFTFAGNRYGVMICFDWAFPEIARILALKGAQIILHPANLVLPYCQNAMVTRCIENRVFAATANRIGEERGLNFSGMSQIVNPSGEVIVRIPDGEIGLRYVDINPQKADNKMITERNDVIRDRTPELYDRLVFRR